MATETMTTREKQNLHCGLVASLKSSSEAVKDRILFLPDTQEPAKVPPLVPTLKNRVTLEVALILPLPESHSKADG